MPHRPPAPTGRHFKDGPEKAGVPVRPQVSQPEDLDPAEARRRAAERAARAAAAYAAHTANRAAFLGEAEDTAVIPVTREGRKPGGEDVRERGAGPEAPAPFGGREGSGEDKKQAGSPKSVARSSFVMFLGSLVSRFLGLVRSPILLGAIVGVTTPAADAFAVANKLPNLIYMIIVGGLVNAVLVPSIVRATKESKDGGEAFLNKLLTLSIVSLGSVTFLLTLGAPYVAKFFASTMEGKWFTLTVAFAYWCLPQIFFYGMYTVLGQILNARENFGPYMWAPVLNNVVSIVGFLGVLRIFGGAERGSVEEWDPTRVMLLGGVSTAGIAVQALVLVWPMRNLGIRYRPDFAWRGSGLGEAGKASWWMLLMMVSGMVPTMLLSNVAAGARSRAEGMGLSGDVAGNAAYDSAYALYSMPTSLIVVSIATAMFTRLTKAAVDGDMARMRRDASKTLRMVSTLMLLASAGMVALAVPITRILTFTVPPDQAVELAKVLIAMCIGLVGVGAVSVLDRVYYAFEDTRGAFWINLPFLLFGLVGYYLCSYIDPRWTVVGIGLVMSAANILSVFAMIYKLSRRMGGLDEDRLLRVHVKLLWIASATALLGWLIHAVFFGPIFAPVGFIGAIFRCAVIGPVLVAFYLGLMKALKMEELSVLMGPLTSIARKFGIGTRR